MGVKVKLLTLIDTILNFTSLKSKKCNTIERNDVVRYEPLSTMSEKPDCFKDHHRIYDVEDSHAYELSDVKIEPKTGMIITDQREVVIDSPRYNEYGIKTALRNMKNSDIAKLLLKRDIKSYESVDTGFHLIYQPDNYHHWLVEYLPLLKVYSKFSEQEIPIILGSDPSKWMIEQINYFFPNVEMIELEGITYVEDLIMTNNRLQIPFPECNRERFDYNPYPSGLKWLRDETSAEQAQDKNNIFISRESANVRRAVNRSDILEKLKPYDFEKVIFENHSFREQVQIIKGADIAIGVHGAGLTNIIFSENINLIEILPKDHPRAHFYCLSNTLGHNYEHILAKTKYHDNMRPPDRDVIVNVDDILEILDHW